MSAKERDRASVAGKMPTPPKKRGARVPPKKRGARVPPKKWGARVGYFLRMYPRFSQTFIVNEILELERRGVEISILAQKRPGDGVFHGSIARVKAKADYIPETIFGHTGKFRTALREARQRTPSGCRRALWAWLRNRNVTWFERLQAAHLVRWSRKKKLDHVHVHFGTSEATVAWLARLMGGPTYSLTLHAFDIFRDNVDRKLLSAKINGSRFTVTVCESNRRFMLDNLAGVDAERIRVNYNGIDLERFAANGATREPLSVFAVGRLIEKKGFIHLVRAVGRLRDEGMNIRCRIAGEGPEHGRLRQAIREAGLQSHVKLLGPLPQERVREQLQRAACFVLPCVRALDGNVDALPTVLLEAQACGCPTVSTRISGIPEIIEDGVSGRLVEPDDDRGLAEAMRGILIDQAAADRLSAGGRRRAEQRFDVRANVGVMRDWLICPNAEPTRAAEALAGKPPVAPARATQIRPAEAT